MTKTNKLSFLLIIITTLLVSYSCLNNDDDVRTEDDERNEISSLILSLTNSGKNVDTTATGLFYIVNEPGTGQVPNTGDTVIIEYVGTFIDGSVFDASHIHYPDGKWEFVYKEQSLIEGFDEAIGMLNTNMEANFIIPSKLGYGSTWYDFIPPYTPLVFYLKLHAIKPKIAI